MKQLDPHFRGDDTHQLMLKLIPIQVTCYSGYKANERPKSFTRDGKTFQITEILDRWYGENETYFKVKADGGEIYLLKYDQGLDEWFLDSMTL